DSVSISELVDGVIEDRDPNIIEDAVGIAEIIVVDRGPDDIEYVEGVNGVADLVERVIEDRGPDGIKGR
ncbi:hypothetical protein COL5a_001265, partial [Colletotrichum fioriniae]